MAFTFLPASDADGSFGPNRMRISEFEPLLRKHGGVYVKRVTGGCSESAHYAVFKFDDKASAKRFAGDAQELAKVSAPVVGESVDHLNGGLNERTYLPPKPLIHTDDELLEHIRGSSDMKNWYTKHQSQMGDIFGDHARTFSLALAATSPRNKVGGNVSAAIKAMHAIKHGLPFDGALAFHAKNLEILRDGVNSGKTPRQIAHSLGGPKVGQYTRALEGDHLATPIDMHVSSLLWGHSEPSEREHREGRDHVIRLAGKIGWTPRQTQAAMWAANQRKIGQKVYTYADYLAKPDIREKALRVLQSDKPLDEYLKESIAMGDTTGSEGLGDLLLAELHGDPAADAPLKPLKEQLVNEDADKHPDYMEGFHHGYAYGDPSRRKYKNKEKFTSNDQYRQGYVDGKQKAKAVWDRGAVYENFFDKTKGAWRTKGGKFGSHRTPGGAQWVPHLPKAVKATVESLKGKVKAWSGGGGLAFIFESGDKADEAFDTLRRQGIRVTKHDIPGVLYYQGVLGESADGPVDHLPRVIGTSPMNMLMFDSLMLVNKINALLAPPKNYTIAPPHEDFDDEDKAEAYATNRAQAGNEEWGVIGVGGKFRALPLDQCFEWLDVTDDGYLHAAFNDRGTQILDGDDDTDWVHTKPVSEGLDERHSILSRLNNARARKGLAGDIRKRMRSARRSARNRLRRGFIYAAKSKVRSALHNK